MNQTSITIGRLTFQVTSEMKMDELQGRELPVYTLTGVRGAVYKTMRNAKTPELMFLVNARKFAMAMEGQWFTDKNGTLEAL